MRFTSIKQWLVCGLAMAFSGPAARASEIEAGPLWHDFTLTLEEGARREALGPLWYDEKTPLSVTYALPPFYAHNAVPELDKEEYNVLYPLVSYNRHGTEYRFQFLQLLSFAGGNNQADQTSRRYSVYPFVLIQRSANSNDNYTAVLPFGGHVKNRFFRDEAKFVLFPFYLQTRKKDVVTDNYVYPIYHQRHGDGLTGWQLWPFYGAEHKEITTRTNQLDEVVTVPGHEKTFVMWPIVSAEKTGLGTDNPSTNVAVLPLFTAQRSPQRDSSTYLWPLFTITDDREKKYQEYGFPWPFFVFARGEGKTVNRVFPVYSHAYNTNLESGFGLWPIYKYNRFHDTAGEQRRDRVMYFLYSDTKKQLPGEKGAKRRTDLWPLFTARRDAEGNERFQFLAPLESVVPENGAIERSWSPVWSLWREEKNAKTERRSTSLLWNMYRQEDAPQHKKRSFLFGMFHYESKPEGTRVRVFYLPFGHMNKTNAAPAAAQK